MSQLTYARGIAASDSLEVRETAPGTLVARSSHPGFVRHLQDGAPVVLDVLATDELDRLVHRYRMQLRGGEVACDMLYQRTGAKVAVQLSAFGEPCSLEVTLEQTPKFRCHAAFELRIENLRLRSVPVAVGARHLPTIDAPRYVAMGETETLILATAADADGFEDIRDLRLTLEIDGRPCTLLFDFEINRISLLDTEPYTAAAVILEHCDLEYYTNTVRVLTAIRSDRIQGLANKAGVVLRDHFSGSVRWNGVLSQPPEPLPLPRLVSVYAAPRRREAEWIEALGARRDTFPNSAIMAKRPSLPMVQPGTIKDEEIRNSFVKPDWLSEDDLKGHFPSEPTNGPLVFRLYPVTHMMWSYSRHAKLQRQYVSSVNRALGLGGLSFSPHGDKGFKLEDLAALDFDLQPRVIPSWKVAFPSAREILSPLRPAYWDLVEKRLRGFIADMATSVQMDDYPNAGVCVTYGGDFCAESRAGFTEWLRTETAAEERQAARLPANLAGFDYREWLMAERGIQDAAQYMREQSRLPSTKLFRRFQWKVALDSWRRIREMLNRLSPDRYITLTSNGAPDWPAPEAYAYNSAIVDAMCAEIHIFPQRPRPDVAAINAYCMTDGLGTRLAAVPKGEENTLVALKPYRDKRIMHVAESYAFGHQLMIPWGNWRKDVKRLYSRWREEYGVAIPVDRDLSYHCEPPDGIGDVFHFVREKAHLLDGFHRYANVGVVLCYQTLSIKMRFLARRLLAQHAQFVYVFADDSLHPRTLTRKLADSFDHLLLADSISSYSPMSGVRGPAAVYDPQMAKRAIPKPIWCSDPEVYVTVTRKAGETVLHLLNRHYDPSGEGCAVTPERFDLRIRKEILAGGEPAGFHAFRGYGEMEVTEAETEFRLTIRNLRYWALLHFAPVDRLAQTER